MTDYRTVLSNQADKLNTIENGNDFDVWQSHTLNILHRFFGDDSPQVKQLEAVTYRVSYPPTPIAVRRSVFSESSPLPNRTPTNNLTYCISTSRKLLTAFVEELEVLGLPNFRAPSNNSGININVSQNQSMHLSVVLNTLRDELTGRQFQEIDEVLKSDLKSEEKKNTLFEKLSSFGSDVLSGVLSSLLTNPEFYKALM